MLLRNSISNTKKFFQKTLQNFKSLFSGSDHYQRIPKTPPYSYPLGVDMNIQPSYKDFERFCTDFTDQWESSDMDKAKKRSNKKTSSLKQEKEVLSGSFMKFAKSSPVKSNNQIRRRENHLHLKPKRQEDSRSNMVGTREERSCILAEKLKELELIDVSNVDHALDIEEFLHYYSRLTCPAYVDIVDKFFMEMYAEFIGQSATPSRVSSRPKLRSETLQY
ncbi:ATP-dependent RNA helicase DDX11-like protein [Melia azedarach]|uniref:ATP-dependent RNA helicase DDX11-like protein n=1 Tax=Melia azedarach TaxID=155640 RepID=A0ACC1XCF2_MELAZ|nr:ATP-dependent RNA helicase DDX11-like protein [Melia azedarach]